MYHDLVFVFKHIYVSFWTFPKNEFQELVHFTKIYIFQSATTFVQPESQCQTLKVLQLHKQTSNIVVGGNFWVNKMKVYVLSSLETAFKEKRKLNKITFRTLFSCKFNNNLSFG